MPDVELTINEFVPFTDTRTFSGIILSITESNVPEGITFSKTSNTFTITTAGVEMFDRPLIYLDEADVLKTTNRFAKLPDDYHALIKYTGASGSADMIVVVRTKVDEQAETVVHTYTYNIVSNYGIANQMLRTKVAEGLY